MPAKAGTYSQWYTHSRWRTLRKSVLARNPCCVFCAKQGKITLATICDHVIPHKGDRVLFWRGPFQSLCETCHNSTKRIQEGGKLPPRVTFDVEGRVIW